MPTRWRRAPSPSQREEAEHRARDDLARELHATLAAFARLQAEFAGAATDHAASSPIEVRLQLAEAAVDIARTGESLNLLAALLDLPERVPTISPEAARAVVQASQALRSERA